MRLHLLCQTQTLLLRLYRRHCPRPCPRQIFRPLARQQRGLGGGVWVVGHRRLLRLAWRKQPRRYHLVPAPACSARGGRLIPAKTAADCFRGPRRLSNPLYPPRHHGPSTARALRVVFPPQDVCRASHARHLRRAARKRVPHASHPGPPARPPARPYCCGTAQLSRGSKPSCCRT